MVAHIFRCNRLLFSSYFSKTIATTEATKLRQVSKQLSESKVRDGGNLGKEKIWAEKFLRVGKSCLLAHINGNLGKLNTVEIAKSGNVGNRLIVKF